jgi:hypothetical protein
MPIWNTFTKQQRADLVAYVKTFSPRWAKEKAGGSNQNSGRDSRHNRKHLSRQGVIHQWKCHGPQGKGDGPSAATLTDSKDQPIRPYNFVAGKDDSRFKCGSTNQDIYKIFMTGIDGTPMPSFADTIQPNDAWDLVHFPRTLQFSRPSKENDVLGAAGGKIPPYIESKSDNGQTPSGHPENRLRSGGN